MNLQRLPNFLIIGAARSGTSTLYEYLKCHPGIYLSYVKEPQFFSNDDLYARGTDYYLNTFFPKAEGFSARGEATPHYLYYEKAARRIAHTLPASHQRFIVLLRDPAARAYSLYWNMVAEGFETLSFEEAIQREPERIKDPEVARLGTLRFQYLTSSLYAKQLRVYFNYFSRNQFLILFQEDLDDSGQQLCRSIFGFLKLRTDVDVATERIYNPASLPRFSRLQRWLRGSSPLKQKLGAVAPYRLKYRLVNLLLRWNQSEFKYPAMPKETEHLLREMLQEDILDLQQISGKNLHHWLTGSDP